MDFERSLALIPQFATIMVIIANSLNVTDINITYALKAGESPDDWVDTRLLAQVWIDGELAAQTRCPFPVFCRSGAKHIARWYLSAVQLPPECGSFTVVIKSPGRHYQILEILLVSASVDKEIVWGVGPDHKKGGSMNFRVFMDLHDPDHHCHQRLVAGPFGAQIIHLSIRLPDFSLAAGIAMLREMTDATSLTSIGMWFYLRCQEGEDAHCLEVALIAFERALEDPKIDPDQSQVLETIIPFLYCLIQGPDSSLDVAFQVLQAFPGLPSTQIDHQLFLQSLIQNTVLSADWHHYLPLAVKSAVIVLNTLRSTPPDPQILDLVSKWAMLAYHFAQDRKEVLPLMDLAVSLLPGVNTILGGVVSFAVLRAMAYLRQALRLPEGPSRPSLDATLTAAEGIMESLSGREDSPRLSDVYETISFCDEFTGWLMIHHFGNSSLLPYNFEDRGRRLIAWFLHDQTLPPHAQGWLRRTQRVLIHSGNVDPHVMLNATLPHPAILDDNDNQFISRILSEAWVDEKSSEPGEDMSAEYPEGAAQMVRIILADSSAHKLEPVYYSMAATIAHGLRLPETFQAYRLLLGLLESFENIGYLCSQIRGFPGSFSVIRDAVSYAIDMEDHCIALQWSDQARSKIWEWFFHSRSSIRQLSAIEPYLATALRARPYGIEQSAGPQTRPGEEWLEVAQGMTRLPGFDRFLKPKTPMEIMSIAEALGGPLVYLNPGRYSSHALAILPGLDDVIHIPLPIEDYRLLRNMSVAFMESHQLFLQEDSSTEQNWGRKGFMVKPRQPSQTRRLPAKMLLAYLWTSVVKPVLDGLGIQHSHKAAADMPRIWWCPSGPLIALPIHAAGVYTDDGEGSIISDYVVSSYFPSASALAYATRPEDPSQKFSLLTIANPTGAGLPGTEWELEKIKNHTATSELTGGEATVEAVKKGMEEASWVHFACHGVAKGDQPMESALILADHARLTLQDISRMSLPHAQFAFLSACQTARGMAEAPDQSAHLSTGMLACGYRSVIGTMWKISDEYAPFVADRVYEKMLEGGQPDHRRAACALHDAVQALRKEHKVRFETWIPFIHMGV
ncbi:hypothetical protein BDN72DRAFT_894967 [Pluteus cervinus]|uniref:Uncharacterized protein n=1 Tax=Pluteus cervinus TaxID=181527 RepID=A0ACD3B2P4_9AGAR|nr:hypothetical protein BDN72DRAFT_894967 [Pluteus cervinus]